MLPKSALQVAAASMIYNTTLVKTEKVKLINFVEQATVDQLIHFIIFKEAVKNPQPINELGYIMTNVLWRIASSSGNAMYQKYFSDAAKSCSDKKGPVKKQCMKNFELKGLAAKIAAFRKEMPKCSQTARPDKCRKMFMTYINGVEKQMRKVQNR